MKEASRQLLTRRESKQYLGKLKRKLHRCSRRISASLLSLKLKITKNIMIEAEVKFRLILNLQQVLPQ